MLRNCHLTVRQLGNHTVSWLWLLILVMHSTNVMASGQYLLGGGDTVNITVYEQPDLTTVARISPEGTISFPLLGEVKIGGLTAESAARKIESLLKDGSYLKRPQVALKVEAYISQQVAILGQIGKPGNYSLEGENMLVDMLARAGGLTEEAADVIFVIRKDNGRSSRQEIDLKRFYEGDMTQNIQVSRGDVILVPKMDTFYIHGEVKRPGMYRLERGMTAMQALSVGGGLTERGSLKGMQVTRSQADGTQQKVRVELTDLLQPNDVVYVKERLF